MQLQFKNIFTLLSTFLHLKNKSLIKELQIYMSAGSNKKVIFIVLAVRNISANVWVVKIYKNTFF